MNIIGFVILHYKDVRVTDACVRSIMRMHGQERIRVVVVDNDVDEPEEKRRELCRRYEVNPRIHVLPVREKRGFSYANNLGYAYAKSEFVADCILVLNNDIEFTQRDFPDRLKRCLQEHPCHIIGPDVIRQGTGEHQNPMDTRLRTREEADRTIRKNRLALKYYPIAYPFLYHWMQKAEKKSRQRQEEQKNLFVQRQTDIVPFGACLIYTPLFVEKEEKAFEPETPFFYEEYILAHRCRQKGYQILYDPSLVVKHENGAATRKSYSTEKERIRFVLERTAEACEIYRAGL